MASNTGGSVLTDKGGRYAGKGDALTSLRYGEHAPRGCTPLSWLPTRPQLGEIVDGERYIDLMSILSEADQRFTWTLTEAGAGESTFAPSALGVTATTDANDNDAVRFQSLWTYTPASKKRAVAYARVKLEDVTQSDFMFGYYATQTDPVGTEPTHGAYLWSADGAATAVGRTNDAGATGTSTATIATLVNDTLIDIVIGIDPTSSSAGTVYFCYKLATGTTWTQTVKTTDFPAAATRFSMCWQAGEAGAIAAAFTRGFAWWEN